jgi:hypothetical protein
MRCPCADSQCDWRGTYCLYRNNACSAVDRVHVCLVIGGLLSWIGPLAYCAICQFARIAGCTEPLTRASRPPADRGGWISAMVAFAIGLAAFTIRGPRTCPSGE